MRWLVIGIGNTLRRDDGIGPWLAECIAGWELPAVETRCVHQLMPELAADIATFDCVLFLDAAYVDVSDVSEVTASAHVPLGHAISPGNLLAICERLVGRCPRACLAAVPAVDTGFGEGLSAEAQNACDGVLPEIRELLLEKAPCMKSA